MLLCTVVPASTAALLLRGVQVGETRDVIRKGNATFQETGQFSMPLDTVGIYHMLPSGIYKLLNGQSRQLIAERNCHLACLNLQGTLVSIRAKHQTEIVTGNHTDSERA